MYLVANILEGFEGCDLPLDHYRGQAMKSTSVLGYDEPLIYNRLQEFVGEKNLASKLLYGSIKPGIYETKYKIFSL